MTIEIDNLQVLGRVLGKLDQVPDVIDARRLHGSQSYIAGYGVSRIQRYLLEGITPDRPAIFRTIQ
ncbi:hypothetical protein ACULNC_11465 [Shigella flexneri]